ncbi:MAG: KEOPS complex subunit Pcc1 [Methermicoccaceae archaeon]
MDDSVWAEVVVSELGFHERLAIRAVSVDNTPNIQSFQDENVVLRVRCDGIRSLLATLDDYLRCLQLSINVARAVER